MSLPKQGCNLALCARRFENLEKLKEELLSVNPNIDVYIRSLDVNDHDAVFEVFDAFKADMGTLDRVIVNAGMGKGASIGTGYFNANKQTAVTNFVSALAQCEAAMAIFRAQNSGHLVTISSISAVRGFRRAMTVYAATKAGLTSMTEGIRMDVMNTPINVTCIHPGFIRSEINEKVRKRCRLLLIPMWAVARWSMQSIKKKRMRLYRPGRGPSFTGSCVLHRQAQ